MERWFVEVDGEATGPFEGDALTRRVAARELTAATKLRRDGGVGAEAEWRELRDIPRFARLLPTTFGASASAPVVLAPLPSLVSPAPLVVAPAELPTPAPVEARIALLEVLEERVRTRRHDPPVPQEEAHVGRADPFASPEPHAIARTQPVRQAPRRRRGDSRWLLVPIVAFAAMSFAIGWRLHRDATTGAGATSLTTTTAVATAKTGAAASTPTMLGIANVEEGKGPAAKAGDRVRVNYTGTLTDGTEFDSTRTRDKPFEFVLGKGQVIKGWDQGIAGMKVGGKRRLTIPPSLAYGARGAGGKIPANATLLFDVELVGIVGS